MELLPVIEIHKGHTLFGLPEKTGMSARIKSPVLHFTHWVDQGARKVFFKDRDGAAAGKPLNSSLLDYITPPKDVQLYYNGGIRDLRSVRIFEQRPFTKIVSTTSLVENKKFLRNIIANDIGNIALWVDCQDGFIATRGGTHNTGHRTVHFLRALPEIGVDEVFFCAWENGVVAPHPDFDMIENILDLGVQKLYIACNATTREDIKQLSRYPLAGIALSTPLYDGTLSMAEVSQIFKSHELILS